MKRPSDFPKTSALAHYFDTNTLKISYSVFDKTGWLCINTSTMYLDLETAKKLLESLQTTISLLDD